MVTVYIESLISDAVISLQSSEKIAFFRRLNTISWLNLSAGKPWSINICNEVGCIFKFGSPLEQGDNIPAGATISILAEEELKSFSNVITSQLAEYVWFGLESVICNPLHAARRAMAAASPLPLSAALRKQKATSRDRTLLFHRYTHFLPPNQLAR